jgi:hypothetical protein
MKKYILFVNFSTQNSIFCRIYDLREQRQQTEKYFLQIFEKGG